MAKAVVKISKNGCSVFEIKKFRKIFAEKRNCDNIGQNPTYDGRCKVTRSKTQRIVIYLTYDSNASSLWLHYKSNGKQDRTRCTKKVQQRPFVYQHCVAHLTCADCKDTSDLNVRCESCGVRKLVFKENVINYFINSTTKKRNKLTRAD